MALLRAEPAQARVKDQYGQLALHYAVYSGALLRLVAALIAAYPEGLAVLILRENRGYTPLAWAQMYSHKQQPGVLALLERASGYRERPRRAR